MADREAQRKLYAYGEMSNKVQQADRSLLRSRAANEATGEVESLWGRSDIGRMGDRVGNAIIDEIGGTMTKRPVELEEKMERANQKRRKREQVSRLGGGGGTAGVGKKRVESILMATGGQSILDLGELSGYQPSHAGSRASYESLLVSE